VTGDAAAAGDTLGRLRSLLRAEGGLIGELVVDDGQDGFPSGPAQAAVAGPRIDGSAGDYELLIEAIYEGYLLHYHAPRVVRPPEQDLGLLAGDRLYALGLARLVALGDIVAVAELADVIALSALAHGAENPELAGAAWAAGAHAVGWGPSASHERAKALARAGSPEALPSLRAVAEGHADR
jgi:hypothetical protein